jgi:hypothetical protein
MYIEIANTQHLVFSCKFCVVVKMRSVPFRAQNAVNQFCKYAVLGSEARFGHIIIVRDIPMFKDLLFVFYGRL